MKLKKMKIKNFRGYKGEATIDFIAFVGKNDIGKSGVIKRVKLPCCILRCLEMVALDTKGGREWLS